MKTPAAIFASVLRQAREEQGLTPQDLASKLGLHHHVIKDWEDGRRAPRLNSAVRWAKELGFDLQLQ